MKVNPNHLASLQLLTQVQSSMGMTSEAEATKERTNRARTRTQQMDALVKAIDRSPLDPEPRWRMGVAATEGEMYTLAYQCFQAALDLDPGYKPAQDGLKTLRTEKGFDYNSVSGSRPAFKKK